MPLPCLSASVVHLGSLHARRLFPSVITTHTYFTYSGPSWAGSALKSGHVYDVAAVISVCKCVLLVHSNASLSSWHLFRAYVRSSLSQFYRDHSLLLSKWYHCAMAISALSLFSPVAHAIISCFTHSLDSTYCVESSLVLIVPQCSCFSSKEQELHLEKNGQSFPLTWEKLWPARNRITRPPEPKTLR